MVSKERVAELVKQFGKNENDTGSARVQVAIITEQIFDLPGIGNLAFQAMDAGDIPFIMGYNMFLALLSVMGVLLADLMYAVVDPRVKLTD